MTKPTSLSHSRRGQALVPVLFVMLILLLLAVTFQASTTREIRAASNFTAQTQRFLAARGALNYAAAALAQTSSNGATYGVVPPGPDTDSNGWMQMGDAWVKIEVTDTGACLDVNQIGAAALKTIPVFQQNPDLADAIVEWRTPASASSSSASGSAGGTGSAGSANTVSNAQYYQSLPTPYNIKANPFDTVEELLLVKGITPSVLYGTVNGTSASGADGSQTVNGSQQRTRQAPPNGAARPNPGGGANGGQGNPNGGGQGGNTGGGQGSGGGGNGQGGNGGQNSANPAASPEDFTDIFADSKTPLVELLTTGARERNVAADGSARVNINTATAQDLQTKLGVTQQVAAGIVDFRTGGAGRPGGAQANGARPNGNAPGGNGNGNRPRPGNGNGGNGNGGNRPRPGNGGGGFGGGGFGGNGLGGGGGGFGAAPRSASLTRQAAGSGGSRPNYGGQGGGMTNPNGGGPGNGGNGGANGGQGGNGQGSNGGQNGGGSGAGGGQSTTFKSIADLLEVPAINRTIMQTIADKVTTDDKPYRENVVNINTAPPEVLATVPGMTHDILQAIQSYRQGGQAFQTLGDFFSLQNLQRSQIEAVIPRLCTKTSRYRVHIRVRTAGQQSVYAVSALIDIGANGPTQLQWREVAARPGWMAWQPAPQLPTPTPPASSTGGTTATPATTGG